MQVGIDISRIFMINEQGSITQRNKYIKSSYHSLNEFLDMHCLLENIFGIVKQSLVSL